MFSFLSNSSLPLSQTEAAQRPRCQSEDVGEESPPVHLFSLSEE